VELKSMGGRTPLLLAVWVLSSMNGKPQSRVLVIISENNDIEEELNQCGSTFVEYVSEVQATT
jgi:hypothetical protein